MVHRRRGVFRSTGGTCSGSGFGGWRSRQASRARATNRMVSPADFMDRVEGHLSASLTCWMTKPTGRAMAIRTTVTQWNHLAALP